MKIRWTFLLCLVPAALGALAAVPFNWGWVKDPVLTIRLRGELAGQILLAGLLLSALAALFLAYHSWAGSRQRRAIEALQETTAHSRRLFMQRLDHELKNPLMVVRASMANVDSEHLPEEQQQAFRLVASQVLHLSSLVTDMRKVASLETCTIEHVEVDVGDVLRDVADLARDGFRGHPPVGAGHPLTLKLQETPWPLPTVLGDRDLLLQAIYNVVDNACKFSPPGSPVEVWAIQGNPGIRIEITDKGQGIPAEDLPHIGEELYRGHIARSIPGNGLGLALTRAVVERHGGEFHVRSQEGKGTVVTLWLPGQAEGGEDSRRSPVAGRRG